MRLTHAHEAPRPGQRGPGKRSTRPSTSLLAAVALLGGLLALLLGAVGPASAAPAPPPPSFPTTVGECRHGGWAGFSELDFPNQGACVRWVQAYIVRPHCHDGALADFQADAPRFADQLGISIGRFVATVCRGQDWPVSNNSFVVDDPAGTDLLSLAAGHTEPFVSRHGYIYWIEVMGTWFDGLLEADADYVSDDGWVTWADGPLSGPLQTASQIEYQFVDWGPYDSGHFYEYWVQGNGTPINMRVFEGNALTNTPFPARYADNTEPGPAGGLSVIVFEYKLWR